MGYFAGRLARLEQRVAITASSRWHVKPIQAQAQRPIVSFTFDDVPDTAFTAGAAILEANGARGTFYISGSLIGTAEPHRRLISAEQCLQLHRAGHEIGCHTFAHRRLRWWEGEDLEADIARNQACFTDIAADLKPSNFAYPYNTPTPSAKRVLAAGFQSCRAGIAGLNIGRIDLAMLKAVEICEDSADVAEAERWVAKAKSEGGWLIFITHDVVKNPTRWGTDPDSFAAIVDYARQSGCEIATIRHALQLLQAPPSVQPMAGRTRA